MEKRAREAERNSKSRLRRQVRILAVVASFSVVVTFITILVSIGLCLHFKNQAGDAYVFAEQEPGEKEEKDGQAVEAVSDEIVYTQEQVDSMVTAAVTGAVDDMDSEVLQILRGRLENGEGTMAILRDLYPEHVVMLDSGQYYFLPIQEDLALNTYVDSNFIMEDSGFVTYQAEGETLTKKGIDVSKYQGEIDWAAVKNDGVDYAIIRVGIRGYSEGGILEDEFFRQNIEGATANGIPVGVYFFTQALNEEEALEEANFVIEMLQGYELTYPVYLDIEDVKKESCRTNVLTVTERTNNAKVFLEAVKEAGYQPAIYGNMKTFLLMLDLSALEQYDKWFAGYTLPIYYPYEYKMLQYSEKGQVAGINGQVDVNICFKDYTGQQ
ncbi:MAG: glycoside hydrolase family 25 protein [Lachnospiraceae bacterium]|nr:glycoside hydrolase family 25 protein [Lachnospiraceae bacterium]